MLKKEFRSSPVGLSSFLRIATSLVFLILLGMGTGAVAFGLSSCSPEPPPVHPLVAEYKGEDTLERPAKTTATVELDGTVTIASVFETTGVSTTSQEITFWDGNGDVISETTYTGGSANLTVPASAVLVGLTATASDSAGYTMLTTVSGT